MKIEKSLKRVASVFISLISLVMIASPASADRQVEISNSEWVSLWAAAASDQMSCELETSNVVRRSTNGPILVFDISVGDENLGEWSLDLTNSFQDLVQSGVEELTQKAEACDKATVDFAAVNSDCFQVQDELYEKEIIDFMVMSTTIAAERDEAQCMVRLGFTSSRELGQYVSDSIEDGRNPWQYVLEDEDKRLLIDLRLEVNGQAYAQPGAGVTN